MCGCMLMHAAMGHEEHRHGSQPDGTPLAALPGASSQKCAHCGFPLKQDYTFCPGCGMSLRAANCPACGQNVEASWKACAYCGSPLGEGAAVRA
ncbi:MAG: zinc ribbon domain-containing protein [Bacteroidota bacterium]